MKPEFKSVAQNDDARRVIAESIAIRVTDHLRRGFGKPTIFPGTPEGADLQVREHPEWMEEEDLGRYQMTIKSLLITSLEELGAVSPDRFLAYAGLRVDNSLLEQFNVMLRALRINEERNARYHDVWKVTGWRGALFDVYKKATRLFMQYWRPQETEGASDDDAYDLINFAAFFIRGREDQNEWGTLS